VKPIGVMPLPSNRTSLSPKRRATSGVPSRTLLEIPMWRAGVVNRFRVVSFAKVYDFTDLDGSQPDAWRYVVEVQDAGKPADATGYR